MQTLLPQQLAGSWHLQRFLIALLPPSTTLHVARSHSINTQPQSFNSKQLYLKMSDPSSEEEGPGSLNDADYSPFTFDELLRLRAELERISRNIAARENRQAHVVASTGQPWPGGWNPTAPSAPPVAQFAVAPVPGAVNNMEQRPKKPIETVVSALPSTTYKEENESESSSNSLAYVTVQRALLKYAEKRALDSLSPHQARVWTQAIDPTGNKMPKAADALRLCYYMRSQGYDVYSRVLDSCVHLYLVKQESNIRDKDHDMLYWKQSVKTNQVVFYYPSPGRGPRRNAVSNLASELSGFAGPSIPTARPATQEDGIRSRALREANAHLQIELEREPNDPE
jgi:hypothetical protein